MARIVEDLWTTRLQYRDEIEDLVQNRYVPWHGLYDTVLVAVKKNKLEEEEGKSGQYSYYMFHF